MTTCSKLTTDPSMIFTPLAVRILQGMLGDAQPPNVHVLVTAIQRELRGGYTVGEVITALAMLTLATLGDAMQEAAIMMAASEESTAN